MYNTAINKNTSFAKYYVIKNVDFYILKVNLLFS